jgi:hypothetical protein
MGQTFDWSSYTEAVAAEIFGEPNLERSRPPEDVRFGNHGSVSVNYETGQWYDYENERGGGIKKLIQVYRGIDDHDAVITYAKECQEAFENGGSLGAGNGESPKADAAEPSRSNGASGHGNGGAHQQQQPKLQRKLEKTFQYHDESGRMVFEVLRYNFKHADGSYVLEPDGKRRKEFKQRRLSGEPDGVWLWGLDAADYMRPAPGRDWTKFKKTKFEQYPTTKECRHFSTAAPAVLYRLPELIQAVAPGQTICAVEGEAKADLISLFFGFVATCCAGGAKKWLMEHSAYLQGADIVILPDNDDAGRDHKDMIAAALAPIARRVRILELPNLQPKGDVIDWFKAGDRKAGEEAEQFARLVDAAPDYIPDEAAGPQPLMRPLPPPEPFPLDALGPELASAAQAISNIVQSPIEMCAGAVITSVSFAVSPYIDIRLPTGDIKPVTNWGWCAAVSGERKTATDSKAFAPQKQRQAKLHASRQVELEAYQVAHEMWDAQIKSLDRKYKNEGAGSEAHKQERGMLGPEPEEPLSALLMSVDFTYEGLTRCLHIGQPIYGIIGSEGGQFIGGHSMAKDAKLRTIANLSAVWDGDPIGRVRANEILSLPGRRVGMNLMIQPEVAAQALSDELLIRQGFLSRILLSYPESRIGKRLPQEPLPEATQILQQYQARLLNILERPYPLAPGARNELQPRPQGSRQRAGDCFGGSPMKPKKTDGSGRGL